MEIRKFQNLYKEQSQLEIKKKKKNHSSGEMAS